MSHGFLCFFNGVFGNSDTFAAKTNTIRIMNKTIFSNVVANLACGFFSLSMIVIPVSCRRVQLDAEGGEGTLCIHFSEYSYEQTKATENIPDTSEFLLKITGSGGETVYDGKYGDSPEKLLVKSGTYNISVRSGKFTKPAFSAPLYGDEQCVVVKSGKVSDVYLSCEQVNAGLRLKVASNFLKSYPDGVLFMKSSDGKLMYGYSEKRIAYFNPGKVSLVLNNAGTDKTLFTKTLKARQVLTVNVSAPSPAQSSSEGRIHIDVDTSRTWLYDNYVIGGGSSSGGTSSGNASGNTYKTAYNVTQAKSEVGWRLGLWLHRGWGHDIRFHIIRRAVFFRYEYRDCRQDLCIRQRVVPFRQSSERGHPRRPEPCRQSRKPETQGISERQHSGILLRHPRPPQRHRLCP